MQILASTPIMKKKYPRLIWMLWPSKVFLLLKLIAQGMYVRRAGIMLGQYQHRAGVYTGGDGGKGFDPSLPIFPAYLPETYISGAIGKWHLGLDEDYPELKWHGMSSGFDDFFNRDRNSTSLAP